MRALKEELVISGDSIAVDCRYYGQILNDCLPHLNDHERIAIYLRFWNPSTIAEVASFLKVSWEEADQLIDRAVVKLRKLMQQHKYFENPPRVS